MADFPEIERLMAAIDVTWPPAEARVQGGWTLRQGAGGGQRVSAASGSGEIAEAEAAMAAWTQPPLFRVTPSEGDVDQKLAAAGYEVHDPTALYAAKAENLTGEQSHTAAAYRCEFRPAIMEEIWVRAGIGPGRLAVMDRAEGPKLFLMSRADDRPAGVAFVALDGDISMLHAIEVLDDFRRKGAATLLIEAAARFAAEQGAAWLALAVTEANAPARALYAKLGMPHVGSYHYRRRPESDGCA